jgi:hypothetical protein
LFHYFPALACATGLALFAVPASANHPVLVEGNNGADAGPGTTIVPPGTSGDFDGDGLIGTAEDTDNATDRIFGTISAALLAANGGVDANGHVIIVTSGRFPENVAIPNAPAGQGSTNGTSILEAAPGVQANIDAVLQGAPGNADRQAGTGILVDLAGPDRAVILRNLTIRNFKTGVLATSYSRVTLTNCRFDSNLLNVQIRAVARVALDRCSINSAGMRFNPAPPPVFAGLGIGVLVEQAANASLTHCTVTTNLAAGVRSSSNGTVRLRNCNVFDNAPDFQGPGTIDSD